MSKLPEIIVSGAALSDLFFNIEKPHIEELHAQNENPTSEQVAAALLADAREFCAIVGTPTETLTPEALVTDFMERL